MQNGVNKQIIEIKKTEDPYFERVIFIVDPAKSHVSEKEKVFRAKRLIRKFTSGSAFYSRSARAERVCRVMKMSAAAAAGAAVSACFFIAR